MTEDLPKMALTPDELEEQVATAMLEILVPPDDVRELRATYQEEGREGCRSQVDRILPGKYGLSDFDRDEYVDAMTDGIISSL